MWLVCVHCFMYTLIWFLRETVIVWKLQVLYDYIHIKPATVIVWLLCDRYFMHTLIWWRLLKEKVCESPLQLLCEGYVYCVINVWACYGYCVTFMWLLLYAYPYLVKAPRRKSLWEPTAVIVWTYLVKAPWRKCLWDLATVNVWRLSVLCD